MKQGTLTVTKFMRFAYNFPSQWIEGVWAGEPRLVTHFNNKWKGGTNGIFDFYMNLDEGNKERLEQWIDANYKG